VWHLIEGIAVMMAPPSLVHQWIEEHDPFILEPGANGFGFLV
jgi:hypothetical protein